MKFFSKRQLAANRANAQKSTGPSSPEGRAAVSQNRTKHELTGSFQLLPTENVAQFEELLNQFMLDEQPVGIAEIELVKTMVQHLWMTRRADCFMNSCFLVQETGQEGECEITGVRPELERYLRYQTTHQRAYQRASNELLKRKKERRLAENGFESQKRAQAEEQRHENDENRKAETHKLKIATAGLKFKREELRLSTATAAHQQNQAAQQACFKDAIAA
jgi:hypothetical protein